MGEKTKQFINDEVLPSLKNILGPIESFKMSSDELEFIKQHAIDTGSLEGFSFQNCEALDSHKQKFARRDAKRAYEIQKILLEQDNDNGEDLLNKAELEYVEKEIWSSVIVEAASIARNSRSTSDLQLAKRMINEGMDNLYPRPDYETALNALAVAVNNFRDDDKDKLDFFSNYTFAENINSVKNTSIESDKKVEINKSLRSIFTEPFNQVKETIVDISNNNLVKAVNLLLENIGGLRASDGSGWSCEHDPNRVGFAVDPSTKKIYSGRRSKEISWKIFERLMVHEVGVHVLRAERGSSIGFQPLELGMAGYNGAEESLGKLFEDIWSKKSDSPVPEKDHYRYISVSYAKGLYDGKMHNADETFRFMSELRNLDRDFSFKNKTDPNNQIKKARADVFEHIFRAYRGMPEGVIMTSNLSYFADKQALIDFINKSSLDGDQLIEYLTRGKFNPNDLFHRKVVDKLYENHLYSKE